MTQHSSRHSVNIQNPVLWFFLPQEDSTAFSWNFLQSKLNINVTSESYNKAKKMLNSYFINLYKVQISIKPKHDDLLTTKGNKAQIKQFKVFFFFFLQLLNSYKCLESKH